MNFRLQLYNSTCFSFFVQFVAAAGCCCCDDCDDDTDDRWCGQIPILLCRYGGYAQASIICESEYVKLANT